VGEGEKAIMFVDQIVVRGTGTVAVVGGIIFGMVGIPQIMYYLIGAGIILLAFSLGWNARYQRVLANVPQGGYEPTGEVYVNPGGSPVEVWHKGIRRVYVRHQAAQ
jgi:hypothetical protein